MATQSITATPTILASITDDTDYDIQNVSSQVLFVEVAASAPGATSDKATVVRSLDTYTTQTSDGSDIYIWNRYGFGHVVYN